MLRRLAALVLFLTAVAGSSQVAPTRSSLLRRAEDSESLPSTTSHKQQNVPQSPPPLSTTISARSQDLVPETKDQSSCSSNCSRCPSRGKWAMALCRWCFLLPLVPFGATSLWYEQLSGHKQSTFILAAGANWWRLTSVETVLGEVGSVLTAEELGMAGSSRGVVDEGGEGRGREAKESGAIWGSVRGTTDRRGSDRQDWISADTNTSLLELVYFAGVKNRPTLRLVDADVKTLQWLAWSSRAALGSASCLHRALGRGVPADDEKKDTSIRLQSALPAVYFGRQVPVQQSAPEAESACPGPSALALTPPVAYRAAVASLILTLDRAEVGHERGGSGPSIAQTARLLGLADTALYEALPASLKTSPQILLNLAKSGAPAFTNLTLAQFVLVQILAHGLDPRGVGSAWYLNEFLKTLIPEDVFSGVAGRLFSQLGLVGRRYGKLRAGTRVIVRFPGNGRMRGLGPLERADAAESGERMLPGSPFSPAEATSFFPNFVPNMEWFHGEVESIVNADGEGEVRPSVRIRVTRGCRELRSALPKVVAAATEHDHEDHTGAFSCPDIALADFPDVVVERGASPASGQQQAGRQHGTTRARSGFSSNPNQKRTIEWIGERPIGSSSEHSAPSAGSLSSHSAQPGASVTIFGSAAIAQLIRSPKEMWVNLLEDGPFAQIKKINSLNLSLDLPSLTNDNEDVVVKEGELVLASFLTPGAEYFNSGQHLSHKADLDTWWGRATETLHRAMDRTQRSAAGHVDAVAKSDPPSSKIMHAASDPPPEVQLGAPWSTQLWMDLWGIPHDIVSDLRGRVLKLNIQHLDSVAALAVVADFLLGTSLGVFAGSPEVLQLLARLGVELGTGLLVKGYVQDMVEPAMDSAGFWVCNDRMELPPKGEQGVSFMGTAWAEIAEKERLGFLLGNGKGVGARIARLPVQTTFFRNCGDMAVSGHTNMVLFSRLFWIEFMHTSWCQERLLRRLFEVFFFGLVPAGLCRGRSDVRRRLLEKRREQAGTESDDASWKTVLAELYWREDDTARPGRGSSSRLQAVLKTWQTHLLYFRSVLRDLDQDAEHGATAQAAGNARRSLFSRWRSEESKVNLQQRIAKTERDVQALKSLLTKLDAVFLWDVEGTSTGGETGEGRQQVIVGTLQRMELLETENIRSSSGGTILDDKLVLTAIAELLSSPTSSLESAHNDQGKAPLLQRDQRVHYAPVSSHEDIADESSSVPNGVGTTTRVFSASQIRITLAEQTVLHEAHVASSWTRLGPSLTRLICYLLIQFLVLPSIVTGEWYVIKSWFHLPKDTVESLALVALVKTFWWGLDLYWNYRFTRDLLVAEGAVEQAERGAEPRAEDGGGEDANESEVKFPGGGGQQRLSFTLNPVMLLARRLAERRAAQMLSCQEQGRPRRTGDMRTKTPLQTWARFLCSPLENDATATLPGVCTRDGMQMLVALLVAARVYMPLARGDSFAIPFFSNGVLGVQ